MKFFILLVYFSFACTQEIPPEIYPPPIPPPIFLSTQSATSGGSASVDRCYAGAFVRDVSNTVVEENCDFNLGNSCQTKIEIRRGFYQVIRQCQQTSACRNNERQNVRRCFPGENNIRICFSCCSSNLCNDSLDMPASN